MAASSSHNSLGIQSIENICTIGVDTQNPQNHPKQGDPGFDNWEKHTRGCGGCLMDNGLLLLGSRVLRFLPVPQSSVHPSYLSG